jgi:predicted esterase
LLCLKIQGCVSRGSGDPFLECSLFMMTPSIVVFVLLHLSVVFASRRILLLHGSSSSSGVFMARGAANILDAASTAYHDGGPHAWQFVGLDWDLGIDEVTDYGEWWTSINAESIRLEKATAGGDKAIAGIEARLREGDINGIVGHGQGAIVASVVAARAALGVEGSYPIQFVVCCGGAFPTPYDELLTRLAATPPGLRSLELPTMHCLSTADEVFPSAEGERLAECFGDSEILWHDGGSALPPKPECEEVIAWCDRIVTTGSKYR